MSRIGIMAGVALVAAFAVSSAVAQQPQTQRLSGTIEKVTGNALLVKAIFRHGCARPHARARP